MWAGMPSVCYHGDLWVYTCTTHPIMHAQWPQQRLRERRYKWEVSASGACDCHMKPLWARGKWIHSPLCAREWVCVCVCMLTNCSSRFNVGGVTNFVNFIPLCFCIGNCRKENDLMNWLMIWKCTIVVSYCHTLHKTKSHTHKLIHEYSTTHTHTTKQERKNGWVCSHPAHSKERERGGRVGGGR